MHIAREARAEGIIMMKWLQGSEIHSAEYWWTVDRAGRRPPRPRAGPAVSGLDPRPGCGPSGAAAGSGGK